MILLNVVTLIKQSLYLPTYLPACFAFIKKSLNIYVFSFYYCPKKLDSQGRRIVIEQLGTYFSFNRFLFIAPLRSKGELMLYPRCLSPSVRQRSHSLSHVRLRPRL